MSNCNDVGTWTATCTLENTGSQVDVGATTSEPATGAASESGGGSTRPTPSPGLTAPACVPSATELCRGNYTTSFLPDVTMSDLASFRPAAPTLVSEPDGFGVARMPTNLVASGAAPHTAAGSLFGYAVTVRFSPIAFRFDYGDGTSRSTATPGASWSALGAPQFTATDTSHAYPAPGAYTATVTTTYTAQVSFGTAWRDVPGTLELTSPAASLRVLEARTALVRDTCDVNPTAAGC